MPTTLPISRLIRTSVNLTPAGALSQNLSTMLILSNAAVIDVAERYRTYSSISGVVADFGSTTPEYAAANLWFQQTPQPTTLKIGRMAATASNGTLRGAPLTVAEQALANFTAVASGGFSYSRNGGASTNVAAINLTGAANLSAVAALVTAALTGVTVVWNATALRFEATSSTTGVGSSVSFFGSPAAGTDISGLLKMRGSSSGAYVSDGVAAETPVAAVAFFDLNYGQTWYALMVLGAVNADHLAIAALVESMANKHVYGVTTQEAGSLVAVTTTDIGYQLSQLGYNRTFVQYSSASAYAVASLLARILTTNYTGNQTVITLAYKLEPGITPEYINTNQADVLKAKRVNAFLAHDNDTSIILNGVACSGVFIDTIIGTDWLATTLQNIMYNALYTTTTKVPQTDAGMHLLVTLAESVLSQAVDNGLLAPGVWQSGGFGILNTLDYLPKGYYVFAPRVATQSAADRAARRSVPIQIAAKLAGAIHEISIGVTVNQ
jgi:hypothetical protein